MTARHGLGQCVWVPRDSDSAARAEPVCVGADEKTDAGDSNSIHMSHGGKHEAQSRSPIRRLVRSLRNHSSHDSDWVNNSEFNDFAFFCKFLAAFK